MHKVLVTASKSGGGTHFSAQSDIWSGSEGTLRFQKDHHGMAKEDYHLVEFVLDDCTGEGLHFPSVPHDAMWVIKVEGSERVCPDRSSVSDYEVIEPLCVCDDGQRLIVRNHNPRQEQWAFTLNFLKRGSDNSGLGDYVAWDPIILNQNGGSHG